MTPEFPPANPIFPPALPSFPPANRALTPKVTAKDLLEQAHRVVYKETPTVNLHVYIFPPETPEIENEVGTPFQATEGFSSPVMAFFHSSLWDQGQVSQFVPQALHFSNRGFTSLLFEYRISSLDGKSGPLQAVSDARSAIRWIRRNAAELTIDPDRIAVMGALAGAHAALLTAHDQAFDEADEELDFFCHPNALILFSPILRTYGRLGTGMDRFPTLAVAKSYSPNRLLHKEMPPSLIFHGKEDRIVPYQASLSYSRWSKWKRNRCDLHLYPNQGNGFFNFNLNPEMSTLTTHETDEFLVSLGWIQPNEEIIPH